MPELPEVETIVRELAPSITGRTIHSAKFYKTDVLRDVSVRKVTTTLRGNTIRGINRRAKHIVIALDGDHRLIIQLRMTGNLLLYDRALTAEERRYVVLHISFADNMALVFRDVRRLGTVSLLDQPTWLHYTARIGPEPLDTELTDRAFFDVLRSTGQSLKKAIMDQRRIAGVGNIYANEALFHARLDPSRASNAVSLPEASELLSAIRTILQAAVDAGGTTFRDYRNAAGEPGSYQHGLHVYGRGGQQCIRCKTRLHTTHAIDGRATTFCWRCQKS